MLLLEPSPNGTICECFETNTIPNTSITDQTQQREQLQEDNHEKPEKNNTERAWTNCGATERIMLLRNLKMLSYFGLFSKIDNRSARLARVRRHFLIFSIYEINIFVCCQPIKNGFASKRSEEVLQKKMFWHEHWRTPLRNTWLTSNADFWTKTIGRWNQTYGGRSDYNRNYKLKSVSVCVILKWMPQIEKCECIHEWTCDLQECNR